MSAAAPVRYRVGEAGENLVTFETHHHFVDSRDTAVGSSSLRFMPKKEVAEHPA